MRAPLFALLPLTLGVSLASPPVLAADAAAPDAAATAPSDNHMMMDHSPADGKAMRKMHDQPTAPHHKGKTKPRKPEAHMMMDHSPADAKGMRNMKEKDIPIHHEGDPVPKSDGPAQDHMMMDHSPADAKGMSRMKDKEIPIHHADPSSSNQH